MAAKKNFLRPSEIEECEEDKRLLNSMIDRRKYDRRVQHAEIQRSLRAVDKRMEQAPPDLTPDQRDRVSKRIEELESKLQDGILSQEEMRRNPPHAVPQNLRWQRKNKANIHEWKNLQLALMKGASQTDVAEALNVARLRPRVNQLNMHGAQIPQTRAYSFPTPQYSEAWDRIFGGESEAEFAPDAVEALDAQATVEAVEE